MTDIFHTGDADRELSFSGFWHWSVCGASCNFGPLLPELSMRLLLTAIVLLAVAEAPRSPKLRTTQPSVVRPTHTRTPPGVRRGDPLFLRLVVNRARWYPQADNGPSIVVETIGEEGKPPQI